MQTIFIQPSNSFNGERKGNGELRFLPSFNVQNFRISKHWEGEDKYNIYLFI